MNTLADVKNRQREAEIEKLRKDNELKSLQRQAREAIGDKSRFKRLSLNCARTEMLAEYWGSVIDQTNDAAFVFERLRMLLKSGQIQGEIKAFLDTAKLRSPKVALDLDEFQKNLSQLSISTMAQLDQLSEPQMAEPKLEEKAKEWEERLLKEGENNKEDTSDNLLESGKSRLGKEKTNGIKG